MNHKRRKFLVDRPVQIALVLRMFFQWVTFLAAVMIGLPLFGAIILGDISTPLNERLRQATADAGILLVIFLLLLPYFIYDSFKTTNRFAGPMYRLHQTIRGLAAGEPFRPIKFRQGDYWQEVAADFNAAIERVQGDSTALPNAEHADEPEEPAMV